MATKIQVRKDTAANWASANPILAQGEPAIEIDTGILRLGDGVNNFSDLDTYIPSKVLTQEQYDALPDKGTKLYIIINPQI